MIGLEPAIVSPTSLAEAYALLAEGGPAWRPIAGGTDVMVQLAAAAGEAGTSGAESTPGPERLLDLWGLEELRGIELGGDGRELVLGALTTYTEVRRSPLCAAHLPALVEAVATIGAAQIQNRGTLGGNVVNASPAGDTLPVLLAADTRIVLGSARGERSVAAADFWPAYRRTARAEDELVLRLRIPLPTRRRMRFRKVGTRRAQAISKVVVALAWREDGGVWRDVRLAFGSVAPTPIRAHET
ncbi:MAG: FAD binding domain-containing protein, partial [Candidatus Limnocylindrales bacterium]